MPTREQTVINAIQIFDGLDYSPSLDVENAWLGIYRTLLWYEPIDWLGYDQLPHIIDADKLRPSSPAKKRSWTNPSIWQIRSRAISEYLAEKIGCPVRSVPDHTDLLMKNPAYEGMQRQNILGSAFVGLEKHVLAKFSSTGLSYETEVEATRIFPGITFPGRSVTPRIDLLVCREDIPHAIISAKWSLRHDRLSDLTNECPVYKAAYERIYRGVHRGSLLYYVITNEFDPARLTKILDDSCVNGVIHVHKAAVVEICQLNGRLEQLIDFSEFIHSTTTW
jgi:hypothetical protein